MGTAGGVKTTTIFALFLNIHNSIRNKKNSVIFSRSFSSDRLQKASAIVIVSLSLSLILTALLALSDGIPILDSMFEIFSATGTVGLSRSITPYLHPIGKMIVILGMYAGRIGPVSMVVLFHTKKAEVSAVTPAHGKFYIG